MKRVIEIDKDMLNVLRKAEDMDCEVSAEARIINKSISLNEVLDKIEDNIRELITVTIDDGSDGYDTMVDLDEVIGIIRSYKENEDRHETT